MTTKPALSFWELASWKIWEEHRKELELPFLDFLESGSVYLHWENTDSESLFIFNQTSVKYFAKSKEEAIRGVIEHNNLNDEIIAWLKTHHSS